MDPRVCLVQFLSKASLCSSSYRGDMRRPINGFADLAADPDRLITPTKTSTEGHDQTLNMNGQERLKSNCQGCLVRRFFRYKTCAHGTPSTFLDSRTETTALLSKHVPLRCPCTYRIYSSLSSGSFRNRPFALRMCAKPGIIRILGVLLVSISKRPEFSPRFCRKHTC